MTTAPAAHLLAQLVNPLPGTQCAGARLWLADITADMLVQLRPATDGVPNSTVLGESLLTPDVWATHGAAGSLFSWAPVRLEAQKYAIVAIGGGAGAKIAQAQIGAQDAASGKWVGAQPYQVDALLNLGGDGTWTPRLDACLRFELLTPHYDQPQQTVHLGAVHVDGATDLAIEAGVISPEPGAGCAFQLKLDDGRQFTMPPRQRQQLPAAYTGNVNVTAILQAGATMGAVLEPGTALLHGAVATTGSYVSTRIAAAGGTELRVEFDAHIPPGAAVQVSMQPDGASTWTDVPFHDSTPGRAGVIGVEHRLTNINTAGLRLRLLLTGTPLARPFVTNLRAVVL